MSSLLGLLARRYAAGTTIWLLITGGLVLATVPSYGSSYPDAAARRAAVLSAQHDAATTLLYGRLPDPGTPGQLFGWEMGAYLTLLVAVLGVLTAVRLTRAGEQDGTTEVLRAAGLGRLAPLAASFVVLAGTGALLGLVSTAGLGVRAVDGVDRGGAVAFGSVVALTFLLTALVTVVLAQLVPTAWAARVAGGLALAGFVAVRAAADTQDRPWLNRLTPLGLRATVAPFTADRWAPLAVAGLAAILLGLVAVLLERSRELGGSVVRIPAGRVRRLRVSSPFGLAWRLDRATTVWWVVGIGAGAALFTAMGSTAVEAARQDRLSGGFLGAQLAGDDPAVAYFRYTATVVAILVAAFGLLLTLAAVAEERRGAGEHLRATGSSPARVLSGHLAVALLGAALALGAAAVLTGTVAPRTVSGPGVGGEAAGQVLGQWSGVLVLTGVPVLLAGRWPRLAWLSWLPFAGSVVLALLGTLLGLPQALIDLGAFHHAGGILAPALRTAVFAVAAGAGLYGIGRRDLALG